MGRRLGPRPVAEVISIGARLCGALSAAHEAGILHRDVKPHNVLLGRDGAIKLTDFGIASFVSSQVKNALFGTPGYLPPEAIQGTGVGRAGDLFALGAVAYRCLTGRSAYEGRTPKEVLWNTMNKRPPRLLEIGIEVPSEVDAIVAGLLEPNPHRRIGDAMLLAAELDRLTTFWGWRWAMPPSSLVRSATDAAAAPTEVPHAQMVASLGDETRPLE
jgi:serine/threonine-protein kinase